MGATMSKIDLIESRSLFGDAVKAINRQPPREQRAFSVLRKVPLGCTDSDNTWYGSSVSLENSTLFEALAFSAISDLEGSVITAQNLEDPPTRIRALASVIKTVVIKKRKKQP
jgi:hypothetical protein